jgi:hypothetical protein
MPCPDLAFDGRNLPAAALDSCRHLPTLLRDFIKGAYIAV